MRDVYSSGAMPAYQPAGGGRICQRIAGRRNDVGGRGKFFKALDAAAERDYKPLKEFKLSFWCVDKVNERNVQ